jgi:hypothetical protein
MLASTAKLQVPAASLEEAPIDGDDLRVLAGSSIKLRGLWRGCGSGFGRGEAGMGGEAMGVKKGGAGGCYL